MERGRRADPWSGVAFDTPTAVDAKDGTGRPTLRQLEEYCTISDEGWGDAFRDAGVQLGIHVPSGAISFDDAVDVLEAAFARLDTWGCESGHVLRSLRRGLVYGARTERASWL